MRKLLLLTSLAVSISVSGVPMKALSKEVVGWLEKVCICPEDLVIHAKLDTGAKNSSLNASQLTVFERDGEQWVRFDVTNRSGKKATFERKVFRVAKIKRHAGRSQERFAIRMEICLRNVSKEVEVNLVDRSGFIYQMLVGRSFLSGDFLVDPSLKFTGNPDCKGVPPQ